MCCPLFLNPSLCRELKGFFFSRPRRRLLSKTKVCNRKPVSVNDILKRNYGFTLKRSAHISASNIILSVSKENRKNHEEYTLSVTKDRITISGDNAGVFYGMQTLLQLLPVDSQKVYEIPCCEILDAPRYAWRGCISTSAGIFSRRSSSKNISMRSRCTR